jgi:2-haloacid dehalogenase
MPKIPLALWFAIPFSAAVAIAQPRPRAILFDVFGTCVDYRGTILAEGTAMNRSRGWSIRWADLTDDWLDAEETGVEAVRTGTLPWTSLDALLEEGLGQRLSRFGGPDAASWTQTDLDSVVTIWHRLRPWPDTLPGLTRLHGAFRLAPLSNGSTRMLQDMAEHAGLPWDRVFSAEQVHHYKPDPEVYRYALSRLHLPADRVLMVASHRYDLAAAAQQGMRTAFIPREGEPQTEHDWNAPRIRFDYVAASLEDLASQLEKTD